MRISDWSSDVCSSDLFEDNAGNQVAINTATESSPGRYIKWERNSFDRLVYNMGNYVAKIIGKKREDESEDEYGARAEQVCRDAFDEAKARIGRADRKSTRLSSSH